MTVDILKTGIYDIKTASLLTGMRSGKIRDWISGRASSKRKPLWRSQLHDFSDNTQLGFLDLMEIVAVQALRDNNYSVKTIRNFINKIQEEYGDCYALVHQPFNMAGRGIYLKEKQNPSNSFDVNSGQYHLQFFADRPPEEQQKDRIVIKALKRLEFRGDDRMIWLAFDNIIVLDPLRSLGQPIIDRASVTTRAVSRMAKTYNNDTQAVLDGLLITQEEYDAAIKFETNVMGKLVA